MKNLRILREKAVLTQSQLAEILHVDRQVIYKYEKGLSQASFLTLSKISKIFNVPIEYLTDDKKDIASYIENNLLELNNYEKRFLDLFRDMDEASRKNIVEICRKLVEMRRAKSD